MTRTGLRFRGKGVTLAADRWEASSAAEPRGTVLLLHGGGQTRHSWSRSGPRFAAHGWTTYALDARGHGDTDWSPAGDYTIDGFIADVHAVVEQLGVRPVLVGASLGGLTSLVAQGEAPDLARALVLVDIAPRTEAAGVERILTFMASHRGGFADLDEVAAAIQAYNPRRERRVNHEGLKKNVRRHEDGRWYWHWDPAFLDIGDEPSRFTAQERLDGAAARIDVPTLLVRGARSDVVSEGGAADLQRLIPSAEVTEVVAGHMVAGDDNDVFADKVVEFLTRRLA